MNIQALSQLSSFTGVERYYHLGPLFPGLVYSDGARHLAQNADCYWLLQEIAGAQKMPLIKDDDMLQEMQFWTLKPKYGNEHVEDKAALICERDGGDVALVIPVPFTDFPFEAFPNQEAKLLVAPTLMGNGKRVMVAYLPSEY